LSGRTLLLFALAVMRALAACTVVLAFAAMPARAQVIGTGLSSDTLHGAAPYGNPIQDERVYIHGVLNQFEGRVGGGNYFRWDGEAWAGTDWNRPWLKSECRDNADGNGKVSDGDQALLHDRPISRYFDVQTGMRYDLDGGAGPLPFTCAP
jgi:copper resistance protein B